MDLFYTAAKEPMILAAGRLSDEAKNIAALTTAAGSVPWPIYLAGEIRTLEDAADQTRNCRRLGVLAPETLAAWYARAAIYALPARYEPFGLSALEAALSGCALVLGDIPTLREVWGDAAIFVPPDDSHRLVAAIRSLIARPTLRHEMARRSRKRAQKFTANRMARKYAEFYNSLSSKRGIACAS